MADRYRGSRYDRGDEGQGHMPGGGRDVENRDWRDDYSRSSSYRYGRRGDTDRGGLYGGRDTGRGGEEIAGFRGTGTLGGDYGQARTDLDRGWEPRQDERPSYRGRGPKNYQRSRIAT
jgi:hypothetical protein